jgi:hypothetical protein
LGWAFQYDTADEERAEPAVTAQRLDGVRFEFEVASSAWLTSDRSAKVKFPVLAISPSGFTWLFEQTSDTTKMPIGFTGIYTRQKTALRFFDTDGTVWQLVRIRPKKKLWFWHHLFFATKMIDVQMDFERLNEGGISSLKSSFAEAVRADDDILTQFRSRDAVLKRIAKALSTEDVFAVYQWTRRE